MSWQHYFVFLTIPLIFLAEAYFSQKQNLPKILLLVIYLTVAINIRGAPQFGLLNPFIYSHIFVATVVIYFLLLKNDWSVCKPSVKHLTRAEVISGRPSISSKFALDKANKS